MKRISIYMGFLGLLVGATGSYAMQDSSSSSSSSSQVAERIASFGALINIRQAYSGAAEIILADDPGIKDLLLAFYPALNISQTIEALGYDSNLISEFIDIADIKNLIKSIIEQDVTQAQVKKIIKLENLALAFDCSIAEISQHIDIDEAIKHVTAFLNGNTVSISNLTSVLALFNNKKKTQVTADKTQVAATKRRYFDFGKFFQQLYKTLSTKPNEDEVRLDRKKLLKIINSAIVYESITSTIVMDSQILKKCINIPNIKLLLDNYIDGKEVGKQDLLDIFYASRCTQLLGFTSEQDFHDLLDEVQRFVGIKDCALLLVNMLLGRDITMEHVERALNFHTIAEVSGFSEHDLREYFQQIIEDEAQIQQRALLASQQASVAIVAHQHNRNFITAQILERLAALTPEQRHYARGLIIGLGTCASLWALSHGICDSCVDLLDVQTWLGNNLTGVLASGALAAGGIYGGKKAYEAYQDFEEKCHAEELRGPDGTVIKESSKKIGAYVGANIATTHIDNKIRKFFLHLASLAVTAYPALSEPGELTEDEIQTGTYSLFVKSLSLLQRNALSHPTLLLYAATYPEQLTQEEAFIKTLTQQQARLLFKLINPTSA